MTNEQNAVAVIRLMQEATSRESARFEFESFPLDVLCSQNNALGSFKIRVNFSD